MFVLVVTEEMYPLFRSYQLMTLFLNRYDFYTCTINFYNFSLSHWQSYPNFSFHILVYLATCMCSVSVLFNYSCFLRFVFHCGFSFVLSWVSLKNCLNCSDPSNFVKSLNHSYRPFKTAYFLFWFGWHCFFIWIIFLWWNSYNCFRPFGYRVEGVIFCQIIFARFQSVDLIVRFFSGTISNMLLIKLKIQNT